MHRLLIPIIFALFLGSGGVLAQLDSDEGERDYRATNDRQDVLLVRTYTDNVGALMLRQGGVESRIMGVGENTPYGKIDGIGSNPHLNDIGSAVWQVEYEEKCEFDGDTNRHCTGLFMGHPKNVIHIASTGDTVEGEKICSIEPWPQININDQVFWGSSVEAGGICQEDGDNRWGGQVENSRKVIFRYTPR